MIYHISINNEDFEPFFEDNKIYTVPYTIIKYKNNTSAFQGVKTDKQILESILKLKQTPG